MKQQQEQEQQQRKVKGTELAAQQEPSLQEVAEESALWVHRTPAVLGRKGIISEGGQRRRRSFFIASNERKR
jgi:hypothetical protein